MFDDATARAVATIAARINVEPAALLAVTETATYGGSGTHLLFNAAIWA